MEPDGLLMVALAVFSDLQAGEMFHFPGHPTKVFRVRNGGWFRPTNADGVDFGRCLRTKADTAVMRVTEEPRAHCLYCGYLNRISRPTCHSCHVAEWRYMG